MSKYDPPLKRRDPATPPNGEPSSPPRQPEALWELAPGGEWPVEGCHDAAGLLVEGRSGPISRTEIAREALDKLVHHLTLACSWPGDWAQRLDVIGAYRFYVMEFAPRPDVSPYLQVWSEAGDPLLFEVSSGHGYAPTEAYLSAELRESLLDRGFEVGGPAQNYRKRVVVRDEAAIRALAREMLAITVDVFGYDGTSALTFRLHQDSRMDPGRVFRAIQPDDFRRLLERWGIAARFVPTGEPVILARSPGLAFVVAFHVPCPPPFTRFEVATLTTSVKVAGGQASRVAHDVSERLTLGMAVPTSANELTVSLTMFLGRGVAAESLGRQVLGWVEEVREIVKTLPGQEG
jgi:hypothetical protein